MQTPPEEVVLIFGTTAYRYRLDQKDLPAPPDFIPEEPEVWPEPIHVPPVKPSRNVPWSFNGITRFRMRGRMGPSTFTTVIEIIEPRTDRYFVDMVIDGNKNIWGLDIDEKTWMCLYLFSHNRWLIIPADDGARDYLEKNLVSLGLIHMIEGIPE